MKKPTVSLRKLGRQKALGLCYADGLIEIDPRQDAKELLDTLIHEFLHHGFPDSSEEKIAKLATLITKAAWKLGYRRIEK